MRPESSLNRRLVDFSKEVGIEFMDLIIVVRDSGLLDDEQSSD